MTQLGVSLGSGKEQRYYTALNRGVDHILRCKDCQQLQLAADIRRRGGCECGNKRFAEVVTLTPEEMERLTNGSIDFPYRAEFLAEFSAHE